MSEDQHPPTGAEMRRRLLGEDLVRYRDEQIYANPTMREFVTITNLTVFETIWARPGLDLKTRTLITLVSDVSCGRFPELETHVAMCLRQGWSTDEITETILHLLPYVGAPLVRSSLLVAAKVFDKASNPGS